MLKIERIPLGKQTLGKPFSLLMAPGRIERAALDPATGQPSIWLLREADEAGPNYMEKHHFVAVTDDMSFETAGKHVGMWWEAGVTFHLYTWQPE